MKFSAIKSTKLFLTGFISALFVTACGQQGGAEMPTNEQNNQAGAASEVITELQITDVVEGDGEVATVGQNVVVHYTGWLHDPGAPENRGKKFDSSVDRGQPFIFPLGAGRVIRGWDEGVAGMQIGGKRVLIIPPDMGYGARGAGADIPPNSTLVFEVDLLDLQ